MKKEKKAYEKPVVKTVLTPAEIKDLDQPCAWYSRDFPEEK